MLALCLLSAVCLDAAHGAPSGPDAEDSSAEPAVHAARIEQHLAFADAALELAEVERAESELRLALELARAASGSDAAGSDGAGSDGAGADIAAARARAETALETLPASAVDVVRGRIESPPALDDLRRAAEEGPLPRDHALLLADAEREAGRLAASNHQLRSLVERFASTTAQVGLARNAAAFGNRKLAVDHARRALEGAPASTTVLLLYARLGLDADLAAAVAPSVERLASLQPDDAEVAFLVGRLWRTLGDTGEASEALLRAVALDPSHRPARRALGLALTDERRFAEAREHLEATRPEAGDDAEIEAALAEVELQLGEVDAARARARRVQELASAMAQSARAQSARAQSARAQSARAQSARAQSARGQSRALFVLGLAANRAGDFEQARQWLETAVDAPSAPPRAHYQLSIACSRLGDPDCAAEHLAIYQRSLEASDSPLLAGEAPTLMQRKPSADEPPANEDGR